MPGVHHTGPHRRIVDKDCTGAANSHTAPVLAAVKRQIPPEKFQKAYLAVIPKNRFLPVHPKQNRGRGLAMNRHMSRCQPHAFQELLLCKQMHFVIRSRVMGLRFTVFPMNFTTLKEIWDTDFYF
jgi:hypothetical protein